MFVFTRIFFEVGLCQLEQGGGGAQMISLQMHKRAGKLDQTLVKRAVRTVFVRQPEVFEDLVRLVKKLVVEAMKIADVVLVELVSLVLFDQRGDAFVFAAHGLRVRAG